MIRVLHFYKSSYPEITGGVECLIHEIANGTSSKEIKSDVLSLTYEKNSKILNMKNYILHKEKCNFQIASTGFSLSVIYKFYKLSREVDIIHYHFPYYQTNN